MVAAACCQWLLGQSSDCGSDAALIKQASVRATKRNLHRSYRLAIAVAMILPSAGALAAPFCAVFSYGRQCFYFNMESCLQAAGDSGACVVNGDEVQAPSGSAPFCVVASYGTQCFYYDAQSCRAAAASAGGACVVH
jgi:hypothetical protein